MPRRPRPVEPEPEPVAILGPSPGRFPDLAEVPGQERARRALEIAAAGGHPLLLVGPAGAGKTLLGRCLPGLLPALESVEAREVAVMYARAGLEPPAGRPFHHPPPGLSPAALVGGRRPGAVELARHGVLLLDPLNALPRATQAALCHLLDEPAAASRFLLAATLQRCPCGGLGDRRLECRCPPAITARFQAHTLGHLLARFDLRTAVEPHERSCRRPPAEASEAVAARVGAARALQRERSTGGATAALNAFLPPAVLHHCCVLDAGGRRLLAAAHHRLGLSLRALERIQRSARTCADLAGDPQVTTNHLAEAIGLGAFDPFADPFSGG